MKTIGLPEDGKEITKVVRGNLLIMEAFIILTDFGLTGIYIWQKL